MRYFNISKGLALGLYNLGQHWQKIDELIDVCLNLNKAWVRLNGCAIQISKCWFYIRANLQDKLFWRVDESSACRVFAQSSLRLPRKPPWKWGVIVFNQTPKSKVSNDFKAEDMNGERFCKALLNCLSIWVLLKKRGQFPDTSPLHSVCVSLRERSWSRTDEAQVSIHSCYMLDPRRVLWPRTKPGCIFFFFLYLEAWDGDRYLRLTKSRELTALGTDCIYAWKLCCWRWFFLQDTPCTVASSCAWLRFLHLLLLLQHHHLLLLHFNLGLTKATYKPQWSISSWIGL